MWFSVYTLPVISSLVLLFSLPISAQFELNETNIDFEIGIWFGPVTPLSGTQLTNILNTNLGGGIFMRTNIPSDTLRLEIGSSFAYYTSDGDPTLASVPTYAAVTYSLPLDLPLLFQLKLGLGFNYFENRPEKSTAIHPTITSGLEMSFPAGNFINIGLRIDYYLAIESYLSPPSENPNFVIYDGHFIHIGIMVSFNFNKRS